MKIKLEHAVLLQDDDGFEVMIAEHIEIFEEIPTKQLNYYGKVYEYEDGVMNYVGEGEWNYMMEQNVKLIKDKNGNYDY